jgi:MOSC domain-containing protein YiiM
MHTGTVTSIHIRPLKKAPVRLLSEVEAIPGRGLHGDYYSNPDGKRQITLILEEDLQEAASSLGLTAIDAALTRRNILIRGFNIHQPVGARIRVGECLIEVTGPCRPCSQMDENIQPGAQEAMKDKGGITARILEGGMIRLHDTVRLADLSEEPSIS